ncbi:hypothetical protein GCM10027091_31720 [Streptomyces daliensis]
MTPAVTPFGEPARKGGYPNAPARNPGSAGVEGREHKGSAPGARPERRGVRRRYGVGTGPYEGGTGVVREWYRVVRGGRDPEGTGPSVKPPQSATLKVLNAVSRRSRHFFSSQPDALQVIMIA